MSIRETLKSLERDDQIITATPGDVVTTTSGNLGKPLAECAACQGIAAIVIAILFFPAATIALLISAFLAGMVGPAGDPIGVLVFLAAFIAQSAGLGWVIWTVSEALF